ncbi:hypothetical protein [Bacillus sonorensis]|uniref:hypothetical protein n=1 Tax=Bacillus sonorensis TaxID=119858 RepID=UPI002DBC983A|nr:hypothetical protein [Bacillus sonorensis]MEC0341944.1 hypothetical protein [Bacillus sonorensis]MEC0457371.1 hypothetical protein [Bacillus sonorensis]MEC0530663.1 hypothetical protein [Bacillus sonorensis]
MGKVSLYDLLKPENDESPKTTNNTQKQQPEENGQSSSIGVSELFNNQPEFAEENDVSNLLKRYNQVQKHEFTEEQWRHFEEIYNSIPKNLPSEEKGFRLFAEQGLPMAFIYSKFLLKEEETFMVGNKVYRTNFDRIVDDLTGEPVIQVKNALKPRRGHNEPRKESVSVSDEKTDADLEGQYAFNLKDIPDEMIIKPSVLNKKKSSVTSRTQRRRLEERFRAKTENGLPLDRPIIEYTRKPFKMKVFVFSSQKDLEVRKDFVRNNLEAVYIDNEDDVLMVQPDDVLVWTDECNEEMEIIKRKYLGDSKNILAVQYHLGEPKSKYVIEEGVPIIPALNELNLLPIKTEIQNRYDEASLEYDVERTGDRYFNLRW